MPAFPPALRRTLKRLGKSGIDFVLTLLLYFLFSFTGHGLLAALCVLALIPPGIILAFRAFRYLKQHSLWSVRNRLLFVYGLFGFLPLILVFVLVGLAAWALMSELAIYLASSALDRRIDAVTSAADFLHSVAPDRRAAAAAHLMEAHGEEFPGVQIEFTDSTGDHSLPPSRPPLRIPNAWKTVHGLLYNDGHFFAWAHIADPAQRITVIAPLSDEQISNLVPHLGIIALVEPGEHGKKTPEAVGGVHIKAVDRQGNDLAFVPSDSSTGAHRNQVPPPMNRLDIEVAWASSRPHYHLERPGETHPGGLWVQSRPSAIFRCFFSGSEFLRGVLFDALVAIAVLFLLVELIALIIGISLSRRITTAVSQIYEGTRRVIHGDFRHRIPVRVHDQLGELAESFNQMTGNLERLMAVQKEKERLQTELEIAREVQAQLYPREEPPRAGLRLTARCDPARLVSGDYYDYQALIKGRIAFAIGDIAGKGISAALLMATLQAAMRAQVSQSQLSESTDGSSPCRPALDPATLVSQLNQQIYANTSPEKYATFFFALYEEDTRRLTYTNAGHLSPLLFCDGKVSALDSNGTIVGAFPSAKYDESSLVFHPGDLLVCYTDGITEPENAYGEMFGEERLIDLVQKHLQRDDHEIIRIVFDAVRNWTGQPELSDDMTLLLARQVQPA